MTRNLTSRDVDAVFEALRKGLVPERGIDAFAIGLEDPRAEFHRQFELLQDSGGIKFLRGGYGCGKTFAARLAILDAQSKNLVTSFVVVSDNDLHFHNFDDVYRKVITELSTSSCPRGALGDILDRWIGNVEESLISAGHDPNAPGFDEDVKKRLDSDLAIATKGAIPQDFVRVIQTIFELKQEGEASDAGALISWLCGSSNVAAAAKRRAGIKGDITSKDALAYLRGVLEIVKAAGYKGMVIVIDEAETILRMRKDLRHKSLNGIRQIADAADSFHGLLWLFTGTPDFFDARYGVAGLQPLHDRIRLINKGPWVNLREVQMQLKPFDANRLRSVAIRLRDMFRAKDPARMLAAVSDTFVDRLVSELTAGFKGDVGVVPRQFLRELVNQFDLVDQNPGYDPMSEYKFQSPPDDLRSEEREALTGPLPPPDDEDGPVAAENAW
jgi:hypothetical protein